MEKELSAHQFKQVYEDLGYDLSKLGCIMLDLEPLDPKIDPEMAYYASDDSRFWIDGIVSTTTPHVTLLYGLLRSGPELKKHVDAVIENKLPQTVEIDHIGFFDSPYPNEPYYCIVAHLKITDELTEINERLKFLPHINTFPGYRAHVTLAYVKVDDTPAVDSLIARLNGELKGQTIKTTALNYGGDK